VVEAASQFRRDSAADSFNAALPGTLCLIVPYSAYAVVIAPPSILPYIAFRPGPPPSQAPPELA